MKAFTWIKENWWVPVVLLCLAVIYLLSAGKSGSPWRKISKIRLKAALKAQVGKAEAAKKHASELDRIRDAHYRKLEQVNDKAEQTEKRLESDPHKLADTIDQLYGDPRNR